MRIWDLPNTILCSVHNNGVHNESGIMHNILLNNKTNSPWWNHPETKRWRGHLDALKIVHDITAARLKHHTTPLPWVGDSKEYPESWQSIEQQIEILRSKNCKCKV